METTYRFRFLIYLAAFMLLMSVCFVYAEPLPSQNHLLFQVAPRHSGFLAFSSETPTFDPEALRAANSLCWMAAAIPPSLLITPAKLNLFYRLRLQPSTLNNSSSRYNL